MSEHSIYNFEAKDIQGKTVSLKDYSGKALLIVNTASKCGFTPQYKGLEDLHKKYQGKFEVLGFPCNQFGGQEPGSSEEIKSFCDLNYSVSFPLFDKVEVNGEGTHPLFQFLKNKLPGLLGSEVIKWNFTKFLIDPQGKPLKRYAPTTRPEEIEEDILKILA